MFTQEQEMICKAIDQRAKDQLAVRKAEKALEPPELGWVVRLVVCDHKGWRVIA